MSKNHTNIQEGNKEPTSVEEGIDAEEIETQLKLRDRLNYPYLISQQIITFQKAILNMDLSEDEINEAIEGLINMIPEVWRDDEFRKAIEEAKTKSSTDVRPSYCGIKASIEFCIENGIPVSVESEDRDYYALFKACIDLFERRGMLSKRVFTEIMLGERYHGKGHDLAEGETKNAKT